METLYKKSYYLFIAVLFMALVGFWKSWFSKFPTMDGLSFALNFHGVMCLLWFGILIAQPILISQKKLAFHRKLGKISYWVVALLLFSIFHLMRLAFIRNSQLLPGQVDTRLIGIADVIFFLFCYGTAIYYRKNTKYHSRYMVLSVLPFINPALGRLNLPGPILALAIMIGLLIYERFKNRVYLPYLLAMPLYLAVYCFFLFVIDVNDWKAFWWMFF